MGRESSQKLDPGCVGLEGVEMAFVKAALACLRDPVDTGGAKREFNEVVLCRDVGQVWGEVGADLGNVVVSEGIAGGKAREGDGEVLTEDQDALTNVGADEVKRHSGCGIGCLA